MFYDASASALRRRFTIRGGGVHPELAEEHPGLFLGAGAYEVEEIGPGHWRLVGDEERVTEEGTQDVPVAATPHATDDESAPVAVDEPAPEIALDTVHESDSSGQPEPTADDHVEDDTSPEAHSEPSVPDDAPDRQEV